MADLVAITADLRIKALGLAKPIDALADPNAMHQQHTILLLFVELFAILIGSSSYARSSAWCMCRRLTRLQIP